MLKRSRWLVTLTVLAIVVSACRRDVPSSAAGSGDAAFLTLSRQVIDDMMRRHPTRATELGVHTYDASLEDYSEGAIRAETDAARTFLGKLQAIDPSTLSPGVRLDREQVLHYLDAAILENETIRPWARDPDVYSSGVTGAAYLIVKRPYAPPTERLRALVGRLRAMPAAFDEARKNLSHPPRVYTEIAIDQIDGNQEFFRTAIPEAFADVTDAPLVADFKHANAAVIEALGAYKTWLRNDLLPRSDGAFAYGEDAYRRRLAAEEMIDLPLDTLLAMATGDLEANERAFIATAHEIDPARKPEAVLAALVKDHPPADRLLASTQSELDALAAFVRAHHIVTIPPAPPARVQETPPFLRATTSASIDIPGPFEKNASDAYYSMTLPDPAWPARERAAFMEQWYRPAITNVSVHEVWPGHYLQFLYSRQLLSDVRKVFGTKSNVEGWAHYVEQMMIDEGFHADDPRYRLAQLQDALLRDVRFVVGIRMHARGMSMAEAEEMFVTRARQPRPVAKSETRRGTADATYGYYTMGKLAILKLREDYKRKTGADFSLEKFHDEFVGIGPLALPLMREAMLGERGGLY